MSAQHGRAAGVAPVVRLGISRRLVSWAGERFPFSTAALLFVAYAAVMLVGRAVTHPGVWFSLGDVGAFSGVLAFYLMIRVWDDRKDFDRDRLVRPDRLLQRGVVTLVELKRLAIIAVVVQVVVCVLVDRGIGLVGMWWAITMAWIALAAKDFFAGRWTAEHPVLHPLINVPVSALAFLWMAQLGAGSRGLPLWAICCVAILGLLLSAVFDLARKLVPEGDGQGPADRSYSAALGVRNACAVLGAVLASESAVLAILLRSAVAPWLIPVAVVALSLCVALVALHRCADVEISPRPQQAAKAAVATIVVQLCTVILALIATKGMG